MAHFNIPGQSRLLGNVRLASALPQKTDIHGKGRHVSKVPIPDNDPVEPMIISLLLPAARPSPGGSGTGSFSSASDRPRAATKHLIERPCTGCARQRKIEVHYCRHAAARAW